MLEWEWYQDTNTFRVFFHLLLKANWQDKRWRGIEVKRGQVITGRKSISEETGLSEQSVRTVINRLKSTNEITTQSTKLYSLITLVNYDKYQAYDDQSTNKPTGDPTNGQPTINQQLTTTKEVKKERKKENNIINQNFQNFWNKYPRKIGKPKAIKSFPKDEATQLEVIKGLEKYLEHWQIKGTEIEYIPHPTTWLNQRRWEDDLGDGTPKKIHRNDLILY